eukprot:gene10814-4997_t
MTRGDSTSLARGLCTQDRERHPVLLHLVPGARRPGIDPRRRHGYACTHNAGVAPGRVARGRRHETRTRYSTYQALVRGHSVPGDPPGTLHVVRGHSALWERTLDAGPHTLDTPGTLGTGVSGTQTLDSTRHLALSTGESIRDSGTWTLYSYADSVDSTRTRARSTIESTRYRALGTLASQYSCSTPLLYNLGGLLQAVRGDTTCTFHGGPGTQYCCESTGLLVQFVTRHSVLYSGESPWAQARGTLATRTRWSNPGPSALLRCISYAVIAPGPRALITLDAVKTPGRVALGDSCTQDSERHPETLGTGTRAAAPLYSCHAGAVIAPGTRALGNSAPQYSGDEHPVNARNTPVHPGTQAAVSRDSVRWHGGDAGLSSAVIAPVDAWARRTLSTQDGGDMAPCRTFDSLARWYAGTAPLYPSTGTRATSVRGRTRGRGHAALLETAPVSVHCGYSCTQDSGGSTWTLGTVSSCTSRPIQGHPGTRGTGDGGGNADSGRHPGREHGGPGPADSARESTRDSGTQDAGRAPGTGHWGRGTRRGESTLYSSTLYSAPHYYL